MGEKTNLIFFPIFRTPWRPDTRQSEYVCLIAPAVKTWVFSYRCPNILSRSRPPTNFVSSDNELISFEMTTQLCESKLTPSWYARFRQPNRPAEFDTENSSYYSGTLHPIWLIPGFQIEFAPILLIARSPLHPRSIMPNRHNAAIMAPFFASLYVPFSYQTQWFLLGKRKKTFI